MNVHWFEFPVGLASIQHRYHKNRALQVKPCVTKMLRHSIQVFEKRLRRKAD